MLRRQSFGLIALTLLGSFIASCADKPTMVLYQNVGASSRTTPSGHLDKLYRKGEIIPEYLIEDRVLYLLIQTVEPRLFVNIVKIKEWTPDEIEELIESVPEFSDDIQNSPWLNDTEVSD